MKIIRRNADNVVLYIGNDLVLDADGVHGAGWIHPGLTGVSLVDAADPPSYWLGSCFTYVGTTWTVIPARQADVDQYIASLAAAAVKETDWIIDTGPFFDRFGTAKIAVLASTDVVVKALVLDVTVRKWVDLRRPDVAAALALLVSKNINGVDQALVNSILNTPVTKDENHAVRTVYFS